jgi:hypothetical protein
MSQKTLSNSEVMSLVSETFDRRPLTGEWLTLEFAGRRAAGGAQSKPLWHHMPLQDDEEEYPEGPTSIEIPTGAHLWSKTTVAFGGNLSHHLICAVCGTSASEIEPQENWFACNSFCIAPNVRRLLQKLSRVENPLVLSVLVTISEQTLEPFAVRERVPEIVVDKSYLFKTLDDNTLQSFSYALPSGMKLWRIGDKNACGHCASTEGPMTLVPSEATWLCECCLPREESPAKRIKK